MWLNRIFNINRKNTKNGSQTGKAQEKSSENGGPALSSRALRQLDRLQINTRLTLPGSRIGLRSSQRRRPAMDFREQRMYAPGDDVRFVDWKASARQEHIFIKQGEQMKNATVSILVDCSASMRWGEPPKSQKTLTLAAALGYLALAHGDRLVVSPLAAQGGLRPFGPVSGKGQFPAMLKYLQALPFRGQIDLPRSLAGFSRRSTGGGLVLVLSDLLGVQDLDPGLEALPIPTWNVILLHLLHPAEIDPALHGDFELEDIETGRMKRYVVTEKALENYRKRLAAWRESLETTCLERNVVYSLIQTDWSLDGEILARLRNENVVRPL